MRTLVTLLLATIACAAEPATGSAAEAAWTTGWKAAADLSAKRKLPILADFTGSDWCGWCVKLKAEVFDTAEFKAWAAGKVVLLEVDFPREKRLPAELAAANEALARQYGIQGFPTILILDAQGAKLGELGYKQGGPKAWIAAAEQILAGAK